MDKEKDQAIAFKNQILEVFQEKIPVCITTEVILS